jgi:hypothetical protein
MPYVATAYKKPIKTPRKISSGVRMYDLLETRFSTISPKVTRIRPIIYLETLVFFLLNAYSRTGKKRTLNSANELATVISLDLIREYNTKFANPNRMPEKNKINVRLPA